MADFKSKWPSVGAGGGLFLKLQDGQTVKVRLMSDTVYFDNEYKGNLSSRLAWVIWNYEENKAQIWATNGATYNSIKDLVLDDEYGDPSQYDIKITRTGVEQQTRYSVRPGTKREALPEEWAKQCEALNPIEIIDKSPNASHVMWLEEHREEKEQPETPQSGYEKAQAAAAKLRGDEQDDELGDEPINLDDIPF